MTFNYVAPTRLDAKQCQPGAVALSQAMERLYPSLFNMEGPYGCYNYRNVTGGSTPSVHGEGRALDVGNAINGQVIPDLKLLNHNLTRRLAANYETIGIQLIIFDAETFHCERGFWRSFTSGNGGLHRDHAHIELTWEAAKNLTVERAYTLLLGEQAEMDPILFKVHNPREYPNFGWVVYSLNPMDMKVRNVPGPALKLITGNADANQIGPVLDDSELHAIPFG
jgi:hypothetical protein